MHELMSFVIYDTEDKREITRTHFTKLNRVHGKPFIMHNQFAIRTWAYHNKYLLSRFACFSSYLFIVASPCAISNTNANSIFNFQNANYEVHIPIHSLINTYLDSNLQLSVEVVVDRHATWRSVWGPAVGKRTLVHQLSPYKRCRF